MYPQQPQNQYPGQAPQPYYQPPAPQQNPYDFILNPPKPPRRNPFGNSSFITKLVMIVGGITFFIVIIAIIATSRANSGIMPKLITLAQEQAEIVRVCDQAATSARDQNVRNFAINTKYSIVDQQTGLLAYMAKNGTKVGNKQLALKQNSQTDAKLSTAAAASEYDETFRTIMQGELKSYQSSLSVVYNATANQTTKGMLKQNFDDTQLLIDQSGVSR